MTSVFHFLAKIYTEEDHEQKLFLCSSLKNIFHTQPSSALRFASLRFAGQSL